MTTEVRLLLPCMGLTVAATCACSTSADLTTLHLPQTAPLVLQNGHESSIKHSELKVNPALDMLPRSLPLRLGMATESCQRPLNAHAMPASTDRTNI